MARLRISLANKCQILFGLAVVVIITAALAVPWVRMQNLIEGGQREIAREIAANWLAELVRYDGALTPVRGPVVSVGSDDHLNHRLFLILVDQPEQYVQLDFADDAIKLFTEDDNASEMMRRVRLEDPRDPIRYRYFYPVRQSDIERYTNSFEPELLPSAIVNPLSAVIVVDLPAEWASMQVLLNRVYILIAGLLAGALAIVVFWLITTRIILSPVRVLRATTEKVAEGDLNIRADINTGDEYEQLSEAFNAMLGNLKDSQDQQHKLNKQLDLKLGELAETNVSLHEANRLKNDFLANVSHELRTPLNSIIGFAEVLGEDVHLDDKRRRYVRNIIDSSQSLLVMINELLDLAKIEAGRVDLRVEPVSVIDVCEAMSDLMRPQAAAKQQELELDLQPGLPIIDTDPGKFQQILFNFMANAVKFTPDAGTITLGAAAQLDDAEDPIAVNVWVEDTGPGIAPELHEDIFEKFRQLEGSHTKMHSGAGLGLAICRELSKLLDAEITLISDIDRGARFTLTLPLKLEEKSQPLMPE